MRHQPFTKNYRQPRMQRRGEIVFPGKSTPNWLSNTKQLELKTYIQGTLYVLRRLYLKIHVFVHACM